MTCGTTAPQVAIHLLRIVTLSQFILSTSFMIGCSDGPMMILLNSVASLFILDSDDLVAEVHSIT